MNTINNQAFSKIWIMVILVAIIGGGVLAWQYWLMPKEEIVPLSVIAEKIQQEQVESMTVQGNNIEAVLKDGMHLYSKKDIETSLSESLLIYDISANKLSNIVITETVREEFSTILTLLIFLLPFGIFIIYFFIFYFLILVGFKILKIKEIPKDKIAVYIFAVFLFSLFLNFATPIIFKDISNKFILQSANILIYFLVVFLFLKYYFKFSGKKLWQFFLYLVVLSLTFSLIFFIYIRFYG